MAKTKRTPTFKLSQAATEHLNKSLAAIRKGIANVCEMHMHDSDPSMSQEDFEVLYIDKVLGQPITAISASIRKLAEDLAKQKEAALQQLIQSEKGKEAK